MFVKYKTRVLSIQIVNSINYAGNYQTWSKAFQSSDLVTNMSVIGKGLTFTHRHAQKELGQHCKTYGPKIGLI